MVEAPRPEIYTIAAHRGFADALVAGLMTSRSARNDLPYLTILLPNQRARRAVTEAFVRQAHDGLLLPRIQVIGDTQLNENLGNMLDPIGDGPNFPAVAQANYRLFSLARYIDQYQRANGTPLVINEVLRLAREMARTIDELHIAQIAPAALEELDTAIELAEHWEKSLALFAHVRALWDEELAKKKLVDAAARRNLVLAYIADKWRQSPPKGPVIAAGITTIAPVIARLLRTIAFMPQGRVVLPDLDLSLDAEIWDGLMVDAPDKDAAHIKPGRHDYNHPQYHLRILLHRMGIARDEVLPWARSGMSAAPAVRSHIISNIFLPARFSNMWRDLPSTERRLTHVELLEAQNSMQEALAIALAIREALEEPQKRIALITPDRSIAARVIAQLARWGIAADDSAGQPLNSTVPGVLFESLAQCLAEDFAPVPLMAVLKHPLVCGDLDRLDWLSGVRAMDMALRGPLLAGGLAGITQQIAAARAKARPDNASEQPEDAARDFWQNHAAPIFQQATSHIQKNSLTDFLDQVTKLAEDLTQGQIWKGQPGRALADMIDDLQNHAARSDLDIDIKEFPAVLRSFLNEIMVRPAYGQHPRVAIYGLLEARMQQADLIICAGLNTGSWPAADQAEALLAPAIRRSIGLPDQAFRIGLAAHDLAAALGNPKVLLTRSVRDEGGVTIASPFLLRLQAMAGGVLKNSERYLQWADQLDMDDSLPPVDRPKPCPPAKNRHVTLAVTDLDRLRSDPFQFYASKIMGLRRLDTLDAAPGAAWRGTLIHDILEAWKEQDGLDPDRLKMRIDMFWQDILRHPKLRYFWRPRIQAGLDWIAEETLALIGEGRNVLTAEQWGKTQRSAVTITGKVDRIDQMPDGGLVIIDYKTGEPPSSLQTQQGYALQLGLLAMIADDGGFEGISGKTQWVEYWSLAKEKGAFGYRRSPVRNGKMRSGLEWEEFLPTIESYLEDALQRWILGDEPFTAKLNPDLPVYSDYDQLMRLDEWLWRDDRAGQP